MAELNLDLPKTQEKIDEILNSIGICIICNIVLFLFFWVVIFDATKDDPFGGKIVWTTAFSCIFILPFLYLQSSGVEEKRISFEGLNDESMKEYISLCEKHPELANYNSSLERLPVVKELRAFRRYDAEVESDALKKRAREMGSRCDR